MRGRGGLPRDEDVASDLRLTQLGNHVSRDPLKDRELLGARLIHDELVDPDRAVPANDVLERRHARPWIGQSLTRHLTRPPVKRPPDRLGIPSDRRALLVQNPVALANLLHGAERVPGVRVLGTDPKHSWSVGPERERRAWLLHGPRPHIGALKLIVFAGEGRRLVAQEAVEHLGRLTEPPSQLAARRKGYAEPLMLGNEPPGPEAELEAAVRDVVNRDRLLGEYAGMAERVAAHEDPEADPLRARRQGGKQRPSLVVWSGRVARLVQVVAVPDAVEAEALEVLPPLDERGPRQILIRADAKAHPAAGHTDLL